MVKIILDTDICGDCDDVAAISLLNYFHNAGQAEILAITDCVNASYGVGCIDGICTYYGNRAVDIGVYRDGCLEGEGSRYTQAVVEEFPARGLTREGVPEAYKLMRKKLSENRGVKIVTIGFLNNLAKLIESPADEISPLSGRELIRQSVDEIVMMGGIVSGRDYYFEGNKMDTECNIIGDIAAAKKCFSALDVPTTMIEFELGLNVLSFGHVVARDVGSPIKTSFLRFGVDKRESWDPITVMYAVLGTNGLYKYSEFGNVTVTDRGQTVFTKCKDGKVRYLIEQVSKRQVEDTLNQFDL